MVKELKEKKPPIDQIPSSKIQFYRPNHPNGYLSNFYPSPFTIPPHTYQTVQHYFQSQKFISHPEQQAEVIAAPTPAAAFALGRKRTFHILPNWQEAKEAVMKKGLLYKFKTHDDLRKQLLNTGDKLLVEHTARDNYWGDGGGEGKGKNRLGVLLMKVRNMLQKEK